MVFIYVLKLQKGKYYVGKTSNPHFRLENHFKSNGSEWTKLYKPITIIELIPNCDDYDEDKYTKMYMDKYGIDNVRGGSYTSINMDVSTKNQLLRMSVSTNDRCFKCGEYGHFAKECFNTVGSYKVASNSIKTIQHPNIMESTSKNDLVSLDTLLNVSPKIIQQNIKDLETLQKLRHYKIKCGDVVLNDRQYNTLLDIIDDTNNILKYNENDLMKLPQINSDSAKTIKPYLPLVKKGVYDNISQLLALLPNNICNLLQSGIRFDEIEHNITNNS